MHEGNKGPEAQQPQEGAHRDKAQRAKVLRRAEMPIFRRANKAQRANPAPPRKTLRARGLGTLRVYLCRQRMKHVQNQIVARRLAAYPVG